MQEFLRLKIDSAIQSATFVIHLDHRLIDHDVIRRRVAGRLQLGFSHPVMDGGSIPKLSKYCLVFESYMTTKYN